MTKLLVRPKGLITDANIIAPVDGAMRSASNVVVDQPNVIRSRQTNSLYVTKTDEGTLDDAFCPRAMVMYDGELHCVSYGSTSDAWRFEDEGAVVTGNAEPPASAEVPRFLEARKSLYFTSTTGMQKHTSGGTATILAGVEPYTGPLMSGVVAVERDLGTTLAGGPLPGTPLEGRVYFNTSLVIAGDVFEWYKTRGATNYVVYVVIKRTDVNGYVRRSPPTRLNFTGSAIPEPDAFLWQTYTVTSADVAAGYFLAARVNSIAPDDTDVYVPDTINDDIMGEALYTNPAQQGSLGAKYPPPMAAEVALYAGCAWYGNTVSKHRVQVGVTNVAGSTSVANTDDTNPRGLLGAITTAPLLNGTTTTGGLTVTGVSDDIEKFLRAGMFICDANNTSPATAGTAFQADTLIVSWVTGGAPGTIDITISKTATATGARDILIGDVVSVGGRNFYAWEQDECWSPDNQFAGGRRVFGVANTTVAATGRNAYTAALLAAAVNYESMYDLSFKVRAVVLGEPYVYSSTVTAPADILFEEIGVGGSSFAVSSSNPTAFSPNLPVTSENDEDVARVWYSEVDEPEAVPLPNFIRVGQPGKKILALTPLRSSLLVWKEDGLFRITGFAPDSWRVDAVDSHARLLCSGAVDAMEGQAFAWTDIGLVRASESGVEVVSSQVEDTLREHAVRVLDDGNVGAWVSCWRYEGLVLVGAPTDDYGAAVVFALSTLTGAWTQFWSRPTDEILCSYYDQRSAKLFWSRSFAWDVRVFDREAKGYDRTWTITSPTISGGGKTFTVAIANTGTWNPQDGDWIRRTESGSHTYARIVDVGISGSDYSIITDVALGATGGGVTWLGYEGLPCEMVWQNSAPAAAWEMTREVQAHIDGAGSPLPGTLYLAMGGASSFAAASVLENDVAPPTSVSRPYRYGVPRAVAWHSHFYPKVVINALGYPWRLHELAVIGEPKSERVRR